MRHHRQRQWVMSFPIVLIATFKGIPGLYRDPEQIDGHVRPVSDLSFKMDGQESVQSAIIVQH